MYRGTTPTHNFKVPFDTTNITRLSISYAQDDVVVLEKELRDCEITEGNISVRLTEEDTLTFDSDKKTVDVQLLVGFGKEVIASQIMTIRVDKILKEGGLL